MLLSKGAILNQEKCYEYFFNAAKQGKLETLKFLIEKGFDINKVDNLGETAIFKSVNSKCYGITKYLYEKGAETSIVNKFGESLEVLINTSDHELLKSFLIPKLIQSEKAKEIKKEDSISNSFTKSVTEDFKAKFNCKSKAESNQKIHLKDFKTSSNNMHNVAPFHVTTLF